MRHMSRFPSSGGLARRPLTPFLRPVRSSVVFFRHPFCNTTESSEGGMIQEQPLKQQSSVNVFAASQLTLSETIDRKFKSVNSGQHSPNNLFVQKQHPWLKQFLNDDPSNEDAIKQKWPELKQLSEKLREPNLKLTDQQLRFIGQRYLLSELYNSDEDIKRDLCIDNDFIIEMSSRLRQSNTAVLSEKQYNAAVRGLSEVKSLARAMKQCAELHPGLNKHIIGFLKYAFLSHGHPILKEIRQIWLYRTQGQLTDNVQICIEDYSRATFSKSNRVFVSSEEVNSSTESSSKPLIMLNEFSKQCWKYPDSFAQIIQDEYFPSLNDRMNELRMRVQNEEADPLQRELLMMDELVTLFYEEFHPSSESLNGYLGIVVDKYRMLHQSKLTLNRYILDNHAHEFEAESSSTSTTNGVVSKADQFWINLLNSNDPIVRHVWLETSEDSMSDRLINRWRVNNDRLLVKQHGWLETLIGSDEAAQMNATLRDIKSRVLLGEPISDELSGQVSSILQAMTE